MPGPSCSPRMGQVIVQVFPKEWHEPGLANLNPVRPSPVWQHGPLFLSGRDRLMLRDGAGCVRRGSKHDTPCAAVSLARLDHGDPAADAAGGDCAGHRGHRGGDPRRGVPAAGRAGRALRRADDPDRLEFRQRPGGLPPRHRSRGACGADPRHDGGAAHAGQVQAGMVVVFGLAALAGLI